MAPLSFPGGGSRRGYVFVLHDCGEKVRLKADGWGFCRECRTEFDGKDCWLVPQP